ncbi:MAG: ABC-type transporter, integral rane subunit [Parcubacteria group bacterium]|nr:ABC-type transporter, integral rane subunit [Parcubacteria group bacterium]
MLLSIFQYSFLIRAFEAGVVIALIAPLIGIFLVLRRYSLIADTLAHVSLAGVALGLLLNINPLFTAFGVSTVASVLIERLRLSKRVYSDAALSVFLSGSLAVALTLLSIAHGFSVNLFNYLFGSIVTVSQTDLYIISGIGCVVLVGVYVAYKELLYVSFDEEAAQVAGIPTRFINVLLIMLAGLTVSISIPIVGALLIAALIVIPVLTALQFKKSFKKTILIAEALSVFSVVAGIFSSFYLNLSAGGTIVLILVAFFVASLLKRA